ncbi:MAG TPA: hypothetical protein VG649_13595 [Candidatus Angelobacter sp.]|nr:hypothetical protein [Candidatus Angelobacter sp.]
MKLVIALCCLCFASAWAQDLPSNLVVESSVPSIQVNFAGQEGGFYKFNVKNTSDHGVTAFNVRLLPEGTNKASSKLECENRCGETGELGTKSRPVITPGGVFPLSYPVNTVTGGVMVEAVLLDDNTFQGDEHAAARLLAQKIGFQAEHDRILPVVSRIMSDSSLDDPGRIVQLRQELQWLSVDPDPTTIQSFQQRFSNSADCGGDTCTQLMQSTATSEKQLVLSKLDQFLSADSSKETSLVKWWEDTKQNIISFGCDDCAVAPPNPGKEPPALLPPGENDTQRGIAPRRPPVTN